MSQEDFQPKGHSFFSSTIMSAEDDQTVPQSSDTGDQIVPQSGGRRDIGFFSGRSPSTVLTSIETVEAMLAARAGYTEAQRNELLQSVGSPPPELVGDGIVVFDYRAGQRQYVTITGPDAIQRWISGVMAQASQEFPPVP